MQLIDAAIAAPAAAAQMRHTAGSEGAGDPTADSYVVNKCENGIGWIAEFDQEFHRIASRINGIA